MRSFPGMLNLVQSGMTSTMWAKSMRCVTEPWFVIGFEHAPNHFLQQFVCPGGQAKRPQFPVLFLDLFPSNGSPAIALMAKIVDDLKDFCERHGIGGFWSRSRGHSAIVGV